MVKGRRVTVLVGEMVIGWREREERNELRLERVGLEGGVEGWKKGGQLGGRNAGKSV